MLQHSVVSLLSLSLSLSPPTHSVATGTEQLSGKVNGNIDTRRARPARTKVTLVSPSMQPSPPHSWVCTYVHTTKFVFKFELFRTCVELCSLHPKVLSFVRLTLCTSSSSVTRHQFLSREASSSSNITVFVYLQKTERNEMPKTNGQEDGN